eukprot:ANDGO_00648.mRNA.1 hypothetical protein
MSILLFLGTVLAIAVFAVGSAPLYSAYKSLYSSSAPLSSRADPAAALNPVTYVSMVVSTVLWMTYGGLIGNTAILYQNLFFFSICLSYVCVLYVFFGAQSTFLPLSSSALPSPPASSSPLESRRDVLVSLVKKVFGALFGGYVAVAIAIPSAWWSTTAGMAAAIGQVVMMGTEFVPAFHNLVEKFSKPTGSQQPSSSTALADSGGRLATLPKFVNFACSITWTLYGIVAADPFIGVTNFLASIATATQCLAIVL